MKKEIESTFAGATEMVAEQSRKLADRTKAAAQYTDEYVHEHPWSVIGAALIAGLALGFLFWREVR